MVKHNLLAVALLVKLEQHAITSVGKQVGVFADDGVDVIGARQPRELGVGFVWRNHDLDAFAKGLSQLIDAALGHRGCHIHCFPIHLEGGGLVAGGVKIARGCQTLLTTDINTSR